MFPTGCVQPGVHKIAPRFCETKFLPEEKDRSQTTDRCPPKPSSICIVTQADMTISFIPPSLYVSTRRRTHPYHHLPDILHQGGEIGFLEYLEAVERTQLNTFMQSSAGRTQLAKTGDQLENSIRARLSRRNAAWNRCLLSTLPEGHISRSWLTPAEPSAKNG